MYICYRNVFLKHLHIFLSQQLVLPVNIFRTCYDYCYLTDRINRSDSAASFLVSRQIWLFFNTNCRKNLRIAGVFSNSQFILI